MLIEAYQADMGQYLVYAEPCYATYLAGIIAGAEGHAFYVAEEDGIPVGFMHLRMPGTQELFLNNIIVSEAYKGQSIGRRLLNYALAEIREEYPELQTFSLDVFARNETAFAWYRRLGMTVSATRNWYDVSEVLCRPVVNGTAASGGMLREDENGFRAIYHKDDRVGTVLDKVWVLRDNRVLDGGMDALNHLYRSGGYNSACLITDTVADMKLIERSHRLTADINTLNIRS